jgi:hypothetical protein
MDSNWSSGGGVVAEDIALRTSGLNVFIGCLVFRQLTFNWASLASFYTNESSR